MSVPNQYSSQGHVKITIFFGVELKKKKMNYVLQMHHVAKTYSHVKFQYI